MDSNQSSANMMQNIGNPNDRSRTWMFTVWNCENFAFACLSSRLYVWHSWKTSERVELMASYSTKHVSHTTIRWDSCRIQQKKWLKIFSPLSLNVVFQYLFSSLFCGLCGMTVDDFVPCLHRIRVSVSWFKTQTRTTLNGHNRHLWYTGTELVCYVEWKIVLKMYNEQVLWFELFFLVHRHYSHIMITIPDKQLTQDHM